MSALEPRQARELAVPGVGSLVDLDQPQQVAQALRDVREFASRMQEARAVLEAALVAESIRQGTKTLHLDGGLTASIGADSELEWDVTQLARLLKAGLPVERYAELVVETVSYKVNASVAKQIEAANPRYARIVKKARGRKPKKPYVGIGER